MRATCSRSKEETMGAKSQDVSELAERLVPLAEGFPPAERLMIEELMRDYAWLKATVDELKEEVDSEGVIVETPSGPRKNPALDALHQQMGRKNDCFARIVREMGKGGGAAVDAITEFLRP